MKYLIIGASSGLGRELAYTFAKHKHDIILVSRDLRDLKVLKSDIENKYNNNVEIIEIDLTSKNQISQKLFTNKFFYEVQGLLFPLGMMLQSDNDNLSLEKINELISANFSSIAYITANFSKHLISKNGQIIGFGSISGYLGRKINPHYSASKRALESYFESLGFVNKSNGLNIQFYILGYLDTNLAFGKKLMLPKASPKKLAEMVYKNRNIKYKKFFFPIWWSLIGFILKMIPLKILIKIDKILE